MLLLFSPLVLGFPLHLPALPISLDSLFIIRRGDTMMPSGRFSQPDLHQSHAFQGKLTSLLCPPSAKTQEDNLCCFVRFCREHPSCRRKMSRLPSVMSSLFLFKVFKVSFDRTKSLNTIQTLFLKPPPLPSQTLLCGCVSVWHFTTSLVC